jgi:hypothetical protein
VKKFAKNHFKGKKKKKLFHEINFCEKISSESDKHQGNDKGQEIVVHYTHTHTHLLLLHMFQAMCVPQQTQIYLLMGLGRDFSL